LDDDVTGVWVGETRSGWGGGIGLGHALVGRSMRRPEAPMFQPQSMGMGLVRMSSILLDRSIDSVDRSTHPLLSLGMIRFRPPAAHNSTLNNTSTHTGGGQVGEGALQGGQCAQRRLVPGAWLVVLVAGVSGQVVDPSIEEAHHPPPPFLIDRIDPAIQHTLTPSHPSSPPPSPFLAPNTQLYGLYKRSTAGACNVRVPTILVEPIARER
jgi:hypothetical protein